MQNQLLCCRKRMFVMTHAFSWQNSVSLCFDSFCIPRPKLACFSRCVLTSYFCIPISYEEKDIFFFWCQSRGLEGLHRTMQFQLLWHQWLGYRLWIIVKLKWFVLETSRDHSVVFEIAPKYCILDSFVDYEVYSISSQVLLPTVVDLMVI